MLSDPSPSSQSTTVAEQAAQWVARRDRGLTPTEQDDYLQWLQGNSLHASTLVGHEETLQRMMQLAQWQPAHSAEPNPDLFAPPRRRFWRWLPLALAVAAAFVIAGLTWWHVPGIQPEAKSTKSYLRVNEQRVLADGSVVQLKDDSRIELHYTATERRVRLIGGEAHFSVAKNPARPFVVEAGNVGVYAVGTAFNVRLDAHAVEVLVTEGRVRLEHAAAATRSLSAGQRVIIPLSATAPESPVATVTPEEIQETLLWQTPRLQFFETPLAEAVAEFNRHNRTQLLLADRQLGSTPIGGTFRVHNLDGFVRLLEATLPIEAERQSNDSIVLKRAR